jgi:hypothetical protein
VSFRVALQALRARSWRRSKEENWYFKMLAGDVAFAVAQFYGGSTTVVQAKHF